MPLSRLIAASVRARLAPVVALCLASATILAGDRVARAEVTKAGPSAKPPTALPKETAEAIKRRKKTAKPKSDEPAPPKAEARHVPLHERSFAEIIANYTFVGDFEPKPAEREVASEVFWRYPYTVPRVEFPLMEEITDPKTEMPATKGEGRAVDHLNRGRVAFLAKNYEEAKVTWLSGRARYGKEYPFHRRNDYFIGYAFLNTARVEQLARGDWQAPEVKMAYSNASTFLSWAFIVKADMEDPLVDLVTPKGLYNLAAVYWKYDRFAGAYGAAEKGLEFLRKTGRSEMRPRFHRIVAEAHVKNRTYLEAVQQLDLAIRQDPVPADAAAAFARVGDIYFDLNNYDLAEDAYALGAKIDEDERALNPQQLALRGESLFWLGRFGEAQRTLHFALEGGKHRKVDGGELSPETAGWAALRLADAYLALKDYPKAKLEYYKVGHAYRGLAAGRVAKIREACLELPEYRGNNVKHARELLEEAKTGPEIPTIAQEIAWACQVGSYTDRERTEDMLSRVRAFAGAHPESTFLAGFVEPVREYQASRLDPFLQAGEIYKAISFFEQNRKLLFPKVTPELAAQLFAVYADAYKPEGAAEFWDAYKAMPDTDMKLLRQVTVASELAERTKGKIKAVWDQRSAWYAGQLDKRSWNVDPTARAVAYFDRVRMGPASTRHLKWLHALARHWSASDSASACDYEYPLLSAMDRVPAHRALVTKRVTELIGSFLPELFKHDESCALSLLELEANRLRGQPAEVAKRYLARRDWPLVGGYLHLYWLVSEHVYDAGDSASARTMWDVIKTRGPGGSPEVQFATARLDPTRTEFEKLWQ